MNMLRRLIERRQLERDLSDELRQHLDEKIEALVADGVPREKAERRAHSRVRQRDRDRGTWPRGVALATGGRRVGRPALCLAAMAADAGLHDCHAGHARARHRREYVRLQRGQWRRAATAALPGSRTPCLRPVGRSSLQSPDSLSYPNFFDFRRNTRTLAHIASYRGTDFTLTGRGLPVHLRGQIVSWEFFQTLEVAPALGRGFLPADEQPGPRVVVLSHDTWISTSARDPAIVGQAIAFGGVPHVVAGVAPAGFSFPIERQPTDTWTTLAHDASSGTRTPVTEQRGARMLDTIARLAPGVSHPAGPRGDECHRRLSAAAVPRRQRERPDSRRALRDRSAPRAIARRRPAAVGDRRARAADCLRQRLQPSGGTHGRSSTGVRRASGAWRLAAHASSASSSSRTCCSASAAASPASRSRYAGLRLILPLADGLPRIGEVAHRRPRPDLCRADCCRRRPCS